MYIIIIPTDSFIEKKKYLYYINVIYKLYYNVYHVIIINLLPNNV